MEQIDRNVLIKIALMLDMEDLLQLCNSSTRINELICKNDNFWKQKLLHDYDIYAYEVPKNMYYKDYYKFARDGSIEMIMDLRNIKLLNRRLKSITPTNTLLIKAIKMNWQEAVELLIDKGADIKSVSAILMREIYPGCCRSCQRSHQTIPIVPGSDEYWVNKGHKILDHDNRKFVCVNKEMTPFLKAGGIPCCHT